MSETLDSSELPRQKASRGSRTQRGQQSCPSRKWKKEQGQQGTTGHGAAEGQGPFFHAALASWQPQSPAPVSPAARAIGRGALGPGWLLGWGAQRGSRFHSGVHLPISARATAEPVGWRPVSTALALSSPAMRCAMGRSVRPLSTFAMQVSNNARAQVHRRVI